MCVTNASMLCVLSPPVMMHQKHKKSLTSLMRSLGPTIIFPGSEVSLGVNNTNSMTGRNNKIYLHLGVDREIHIFLYVVSPVIWST